MMRRARDNNREKEREGDRENKGGEIERVGEGRPKRGQKQLVLLWKHSNDLNLIGVKNMHVCVCVCASMGVCG